MVIMGNKIFNKKIPRACKNCVFSRSFGAENECICEKRGVVNADDSCRKYKYDATKRVPLRATLPNGYTEEDFSL